MTDLHELARRLREHAESDRIDGFYSERGCDEHEAADFIESMAKAEKHSVIEEIAAERKKMTSSVPEYDFTEGAASHFCRICGAWWLCSSDGTWQLRSERAGEDCCDNTPMHGNPHIVSVRAALQAIANIASVPAAAPQAAPSRVPTEIIYWHERAMAAEARLAEQAAPQEPSDEVIDSACEAAFWQFDARRKGYNEWHDRPQSERDAFKAEARKLIAGYFPTKREMLAVADAFMRGQKSAEQAASRRLHRIDGEGGEGDGEFARTD